MATSGCSSVRTGTGSSTDSAGEQRDLQPGAPRPPPPAGGPQRKHYARADLLQRTFAIDVLACPECGGRLRFVAAIDNAVVVEKILRHLGLPTEVPAAPPAQLRETLPGVGVSADWFTE